MLIACKVSVQIFSCITASVGKLRRRRRRSKWLSSLKMENSPKYLIMLHRSLELHSLEVKGLKSRMLVVNEIMEVLNIDKISMIGIHGIRGVGERLQWRKMLSKE